MIRDLQFAIRMRFVNSANEHIRQVRIRHFVFTIRITDSPAEWFFDKIEKHEFPSVNSYCFTSYFVYTLSIYIRKNCLHNLFYLFYLFYLYSCLHYF